MPSNVVKFHPQVSPAERAKAARDLALLENQKRRIISNLNWKLAIAAATLWNQDIVDLEHLYHDADNFIVEPPNVNWPEVRHDMRNAEAMIERLRGAMDGTNAKANRSNRLLRMSLATIRASRGGLALLALAANCL